MKKSVFVLSVVLFLTALSCQRTASTQSRDNTAETSPTVAAKGENESNVPKELIQQFIADLNSDENGFQMTADDLKVLNENLKVERHDLNDDGVAEIFLTIEHSGWCGAGSNCTNWIYQRTKTGYELLVEDKVIGVLKTKTNGYRDLSSEVKFGFCKDANNNTAFDLHITPYKYDGKTYQPQEIQNECRKFTPKIEK